jgi:hypothetical protein
MKTEDISPAIGTAVHVDKAALRDDEVARRCLECSTNVACWFFLASG